MRKLIALQLGLTLFAAGLCAIREIDWAVSALAGGGIGMVATCAGAMCITRIKGGSPGTLLGAQILAEVVKIGVTMGLFVAAFLFYKEVAVGPLFVAYAATLIAYGLAMVLT
ncbi:MAG: ATP synthase subunit I [Gammaproteobacteria bacterium]